MPKTSLLRLALILLICHYAPLAWPKMVDKLNQADVPMANNREEDLVNAFQHAWKQVLVKATGSREILKHPSIAKDLPKARTHAKRHIVMPDPANANQYLLNVHFTDSAIQTAINQAGFNLWPSDRPLTLVWLGIHDGKQEAVVSPDFTADLARTIADQARQRGLPAMFPLMDQEDWQALTPQHLRAEDQDRLRKAAGRYAPNAVFSGYIQLENQQWRAQWLVLLGTQALRWSATSKDVNALAREGVDMLVDQLAPKRATAPAAPPMPTTATNQPPAATATNPLPAATPTQAAAPAQPQPTTGGEEFEIVVDQVNSLSDHKRVLTHLRQTSGAANVHLVETEPRRLRIRVRHPGGLTALEQQIAPNRVLTPIQPGSGVFQLQP